MGQRALRRSLKSSDLRGFKRLPKGKIIIGGDKMEKETRKYVCPLANGEDSWEAECELILQYFCPIASMPHMREAMEKGLPECPHSWEVEDF